MISRGIGYVVAQRDCGSDSEKSDPQPWPRPAEPHSGLRTLLVMAFARVSAARDGLLRG